MCVGVRDRVDDADPRKVSVDKCASYRWEEGHREDADESTVTVGDEQFIHCHTQPTNKSATDRSSCAVWPAMRHNYSSSCLFIFPLVDLSTVPFSACAGFASCTYSSPLPCPLPFPPSPACTPVPASPPLIFSSSPLAS